MRKYDGRRFSMPKKAVSKGTAKKSASQKPARKTVKRQVPLKKAAVKKTVKKKLAAKRITAGKPAKRKAVVKKKTPRKTAAKPTIKKKIATTKQPDLSKQFAIEPGPPPPGIPPVEEPARHEEAIGTVTHYYSHLGVAIVQINNGKLNTGDSIHVQGHSTDFTQSVDSLELEHRHIDQAVIGQTVGLRVKDPVREHDIVYVIK
jgi:hypothetical protein